MKRLLRLLAVTFAALCAVRGSCVDLLQETELRQQQIRLNAQQISTQIVALIADLQRNNLTGSQELQTLESIRNTLANLTDKEMDEVITLLQTARSTTDASTAKKNTLTAFTAQKQIVVALRRLLIIHQRQQALQELARLFRDLATRQDANLRETTSSLNAPQPSTLDLQRIEQQSIQQETRDLLTRLTKLASESADDRPRLAAKHAKDNSLDTVLDSAVTALTSARLLSASGHQKNIRDQLRAIFHTLVLPLDELSRLHQAERDLDAIEREQRDLLDRTRELPPKSSDTAAAKASSEDRLKLATRQADNASRTDQLRQDLNHLLPSAADALQNAATQMQDSRDALTADQPTRADTTQQAALTSLQQARQTLAQQIAKADAIPPQPDTPTALQAATQQLAALQQQQEQLTRDTATARATQNPTALQTDAATQKQLAQQTQDLRQQIAATSPQATDALGEAARQMEKAADAIPQSRQAAEAADAQAAATAALAQAAEALKSDTAAAQQSAAQAAEQLQQAQTETGNAQQQLTQGNTAQAAQSLQNAASALRAAMSNAGALPSAAAQPIQDAQQSIAEATAHTQSNHPTEAGTSTSQAQASIAQAQAASSGQHQATAQSQPSTPSQHPGTTSQSRSTGAGNWTGAATDGPRAELKKSNGQFIGLPPRDRDAIQQSQSEKYPLEYAPLIEQYMKNLADQTAAPK